MEDTSMKTRFFLLAAVAIFAFSCTEELEPASRPQTGEQVTIRVSTADGMDGKVSMTEAGDKNAMLLAWEEGDKLSINGNEFVVTNILSAHEAEFTGTAPESSPYTIIYPGTYADATAFNARSYASQAQNGNASTAHLEYNAMLTGVADYEEPKFDAGWAEDMGGELLQNGVIQLRMQLPVGTTGATSVTLYASRPVFPATNAGTEKVSEQTLSLSNVTLPSNRVLEAYMMFSAAGVDFLADDELTLAVDTPEGMYVRTLTMTAQTWTGGGQYTIQCKVSDENTFEINDADDLLEFRDGVNSGSLLWARCHVSLKADIDCSNITSWTPIGDGTFDSSTYAIAGNAFKGTFDGENHVLKDLQINASTVANAPFGLFGVLDGATVKNVVFGAALGDDGYFKVTPAGVMAAGIVAGVARSSTIQNVTNYRPMSILENTSTGAAYFGMVGYLLGTASGKTQLDNVDNYGVVNAHTGNNTAAGATGMQVGGIAGFSHTTDSAVKNRIENCDNHGNLTTSTGRVAGILAASNTRTTFDNCVNRGNITSSGDGARIGGITVILGTGSSLSECTNYGKIVATDSDTNLGGLCCLLNSGNVTVSGGGNHGLIVCDQSTYRGTLIGNINTFASVDGLVAGGAVANYNGGDYTYPAVITAENYMSYIGKIKAGNESKVTNITFEAWDGYPEAGVTKIYNADDLVAFAAAVNSGNFASTDKAQLMNDIDCSEIDSWTPIGNGTITGTWNANTLNTTGASFAGTFDGQGHAIKNLAMEFTSSGSYGAYGFFGIIDDGATVKNLTFDSSCSVNISASYGACFGTLAGIVKGATIQYIDNYAPLTGGGTSSLVNNDTAGRTMVGAIIGEVHPNTVAANLSYLHNHADIGTALVEFSRGANAGGGANGFEVGGIAGFSSTNTTSLLAIFTDCVNDGDIYTNAGRSSGIVAGVNRYTKLKDCINNGTMVSSVSGTFRLGNVTCIAGEGSVLDGCINRGNLTALGCVSVAGVVCLVNHATVQITNCASLGATILGSAVNLNGSQTYNGVLFGYCNVAATFSGCRVSGEIGTAADNKVVLTAENYFPFTGQATSKCTTYNTTTITFAE